MSSNNNQTNTAAGAQTYNAILDAAVQQHIDNNPVLPEPEVSELEILETTEQMLDLANCVRAKGKKYKYPVTLTAKGIAMLIVASGNVANIKMLDGSLALAIYRDDGKDKGTWHIVKDYDKEPEMRRLILRYNGSISASQYNDVYKNMEALAEERKLTKSSYLVPLDDGVWDMQSKTLRLWEDCREMTYLSKIHCTFDVKKDCQNPIIHNPDDGTDWDIKTWTRELFEEEDNAEEKTKALWCVMQYMMRPEVAADSIIIFRNGDGKGCNGKSSVAKLLRAIIGDDNNIAGLSVDQFDKDFFLEPLIQAYACIGDDNDGTKYIEDSKNLKIIATGGNLQINIKYKSPVCISRRIPILQLTNGDIKTRSKDDAFTRRLYIIDFNRCFTGHERKYIVNDYLMREEVKRYVLYVLLYEMDPVDELPEYGFIQGAREDFNLQNNPIFRFLDTFAAPYPAIDKDGNEMVDGEGKPVLCTELVWQFVPYTYLYDLYVSWYTRNFPNGKPVGSPAFKSDCINWVDKHPEWWENVDKSVRGGRNMDAPQLLSAEYDLKDWLNPDYHGNDLEKRCVCVKKVYRGGIQRVENH